ncbi:hypothetical protein BpHYR1_049129 [Brachionus plicatilis]|uniref:Uncharacterized protein n=1 Tax=Brachionus plicatilis TaxID=10195 RepID=A0A3M7SKI1_BRAPC|nr:hypothetical protein BpHYR1_049129 [Brachionus plicatilis]
MYKYYLGSLTHKKKASEYLSNELEIFENNLAKRPIQIKYNQVVGLILTEICSLDHLVWILCKYNKNLTRTESTGAELFQKDKVKLGEYLSKVYFRGNNKTKITHQHTKVTCKNNLEGSRIPDRNQYAAIIYNYSPKEGEKIMVSKTHKAILKSAFKI